MVNRVMEAKEFKLRRQLRKLPRRLPDEVPGKFTDEATRPVLKTGEQKALPKSLKTGFIPVGRSPNKDLMEGYQHRASSLGKPDLPGRYKGVPPERKDVLDQLKRINEVIAQAHSFCILNTAVHRATIFYNSQRSIYILLYMNFRKGTCKASLPHVDKKELIARFRSERLTWVEYTPSIVQSSG